MELRQLRYFLQVAETLNFSEASKQLCITQSTLSQQIKQLENEFDMPLFDRNSHEVNLTEAGEKLVKYARKTVIAADVCKQRIDDMKTLLAGELNIGVTYTFSPLLTETLLTFNKQYPGVTLRVFYKTMKELMGMLQRREVDFVLAFKPTEHYDRIESHVLFNNHLVVVLREGHPLAGQKEVSLADLSLYDLALPTRELQSRSVFDALPGSEELADKIRMELNDVSIILQLVRHSNLATVLAETTIHDAAGVVGIPLIPSENTMEGCIHVLKHTYIKHSAREFYRLLNTSKSIMKYSSLAHLL